MDFVAETLDRKGEKTWTEFRAATYTTKAKSKCKKVDILIVNSLAQEDEVI